jgi:hypothetical protein
MRSIPEDCHLDQALSPFCSRRAWRPFSLAPPLRQQSHLRNNPGATRPCRVTCGGGFLWDARHASVLAESASVSAESFQSVTGHTRPYPQIAPQSARRFRCRLMQARVGAALHPRGRKMSIEDDPKKPRDDDAQATPEWHRARAKDLRRNGFTKMAEEHEQIARRIERQRREQWQTK